MNPVQGIPPPRDIPLVAEYGTPLHQGLSTVNLLIVVVVLILLVWIARRVRYPRLP